MTTTDLQLKIEELKQRVSALEQLKADLTAQNGKEFVFEINDKTEYGYVIDGVWRPFGVETGSNPNTIEIYDIVSSSIVNSKTVNKKVDKDVYAFLFAIGYGQGLSASLVHNSEVVGLYPYKSDLSICLIKSDLIEVKAGDNLQVYLRLNSGYYGSLGFVYSA